MLYTAHSTAKVLRLIRRHLAPNGSAYIGTKAFYFGCGGTQPRADPDWAAALAKDWGRVGEGRLAVVLRQ